MEQALAHVEENGGRWVVLQVYERNQAARRLYDRLGFEIIGGRTDLRLALAPARSGLLRAGGIQTFSPAEWRALFELANDHVNGLAQWWRPLRRSDYQVSLEQQLSEWFWRVMGRRHVYRRCVRGLHRFEAASVLTAQRWRGSHKLDFWVRQDSFGKYEVALLEEALTILSDYPRFPITTSASVKHEAALEVLLSYGFQAERTLLTMRQRVGE
jgi:hypothetical protein